MIETMLKDFKETAELKAFAESQYLTITTLSQRIVKLEEENKHLKKLLETTTDIVKKPQIVDLSPVGLSNEQIIAETQLKLLKETSFERELTYEECKKVVEYAKVLNSLNGKGKDLPAMFKHVSNAELTNLLENS
jgi:hypothetical protein